ncbi:MaoC/PaaZ C-terminal domain-containing protein [Ningiella sp. W23]|uniref:MaoC/PaaZ C-terminal domain-containing protein n=1 Tax=Ningiella sp. W23 TaxID=3023715 RepID=UPI003756798E
MDISQLNVGDEVKSAEFLRITQERVDQFAEVTEDFQWIHLDQARCEQQSPFKTTIAHGFLTAALMPKMFSACFTIDPSKYTMLNYGVDSLRYLEPVRVNDHINYSFVLKEIEQKPLGALYKFAATVEIQERDKPALIGTFLMLLVKN